MKVRDRLLLSCSLAFEIGFNQRIKKNKTTDEIITRCGCIRNGYGDLVFTAYKAGRFAKECGDEI